MLKVDSSVTAQQIMMKLQTCTFKYKKSSIKETVYFLTQAITTYQKLSSTNKAATDTGNTTIIAS